MKTLLVMAGGTGGHVFPALAVAEYLRERGVRIVWLGTRAGLEARVVPQAGFDIQWMNISGLRGKGIRRLLSMPFLLLRAMGQGLRIILRVKPDALLGMGGFAAGPGALSGVLCRKPLLIHEANASAGLTNRWLAPLARTIMSGFPETEGLPARTTCTGNPLRGQILPTDYVRASGRLRLLVVGGSLGARVFNQELPAMLAAWSKSGELDIRHQCGRGNAAEVEAGYRDTGLKVKISEFIQDMGAAYAWTDLVICRAGAMTVAELCQAGRPSILVPFPYAAGDHQTSNARYVADQGGAVLMPQSDMHAERLCQVLSSLTETESGLTTMARNAANMARPEATREVGELCQEALHA